MKAIILVGGEGTRLRPLTCNVPKGMVPILNKPFLEHLLDYLKMYQVDEVILALGHHADHIESCFGNGNSCGVKLTCVVEEKPMGTAGAVRNSGVHLTEPFFVFNGDIFTDIDLGAMLAFHQRKSAKVSIALTPVEDPSAYGVVETNEQSRVKRFIEKPPKGTALTNLINAGIYILDPEVLEEIPPDTPCMFEHHVFPALLQKGAPVYGYPSDAYWIDIGAAAKYLQLHYDLLDGKCTSRFSIGENRTRSMVHPTAQIEGQVLLGSGCVVGAGARVTGPTAMGSGCIIGEGAEVSAAVLWQRVRVGRRARLSRCIVGEQSVIGDDSYIPEGAVLGDRVTVLPGSRLSAGATVWPDNVVGVK